MMTRIHVKPGQNVAQAIADANDRVDDYERTHGRSTMTFERGIDHVIINGKRIVRPSGVSRCSWEIFWSSAGDRILDMHNHNH